VERVALFVEADFERRPALGVGEVVPDRDPVGLVGLLARHDQDHRQREGEPVVEVVGVDGEGEAVGLLLGELLLDRLTLDKHDLARQLPRRRVAQLDPAVEATLELALRVPEVAHLLDEVADVALATAAGHLRVGDGLRHRPGIAVAAPRVSCG
jgi:hypothetical protein